MPKSEPFLTVDIGPEGVLTFVSAQEFESWILGERQTWAWLGDPQMVDKGVRNHVWPQFNHFYEQLDQALRQFANDGLQPNLQARVQSLFNEFVKPRRVAIAASVHGGKILGILARYGGLSTPEARERASFAQFHVAGTDNPQQVTGQYVRSAAKGFTSYDAEEGSSRTAEAVMKDFLRRSSEAVNQDRAALDQCRRTHEENESAWSKSIQDALAATDARASAAVDEINRVKDLFEKQMGLQAPVSYWTEKAVKHRKLASDYKTTLIWYSLLTLPVCIASYALAFAVAAGIFGTLNISGQHRCWRSARWQ